MTREEQIKQAALERNCDGDFDSNDGLNGFVEGAQWADRNQPNTWISVDDRLPEPYQQIALTLINEEGSRLYLTDKPWPVQLKHGRYTFGHCIVDYWMPITDPTATEQVV